MLLTGSRGTGKSSLIKAMLVRYAAKGLRLIEVDKSDLVELPDIAEIVAARPERFIVYCDDLTFDAGEPGYKALKVMLDGTIAAPSANMLIYATSNRRHLIPEYFSENLETTHIGGEVHPGESIEEKISLSERFGLVDHVLSVQPGRLPRRDGVMACRVRRRRAQVRAGDRGTPSRSAAVRAAARLAQRPGCVAVRERLCRRPRAASEAARVSEGGVSDAIIPVAAAVIVAPEGRVLLAQRPPGKAYAGYWEFPGGKIEPGESPRQALVRELREELGIAVHRAAPWIVQRYRYPHAHVELHFFRVLEWDGDPVGHDGQAFAWQIPGRVEVSPLLPANTFVMRALRLPLVYGISNADDVGEAAFLARAETAIASGLRLIQLREKTWPVARQRALAESLLALAAPQGVKVLLNGDARDALDWGCAGVHLTAAALGSLTARPVPEAMQCAASCHTRAEIQRAAALNLDFVVLGPVQPTPTHPNARSLGWDGFTAFAAQAPLPIFALGGLTRDDLDVAIAHGAHGVALRRGAWT